MSVDKERDRPKINHASPRIHLSLNRELFCCSYLQSCFCHGLVKAVSVDNNDNMINVLDL